MHRLHEQGFDGIEPLLHTRGERVVHSQTERNGSTHFGCPPLTNEKLTGGLTRKVEKRLREYTKYHSSR
ncbi:hypothetical protein GCM10027589_10980 [Actinocorallia lasiicapitis]